MTEPCRNECGDNGLIEDEDEWRKTIPEINYKDITFSDGLTLSVPYEIDGRLHDCPCITEVTDYFQPVSWGQELHYPFGEELYDTEMELYDELDFRHMTDFFWKEGRDRLRTKIVNLLNRFYHYNYHYNLGTVVSFLPAEQFPWIKAFDDDSEIYPLQLLAFFYELDGYYSDAKKCLEIQLKITTEKLIATVSSKLEGSKIKRYDGWDLHTETLKQIDFYNEEIERQENQDSSNPIDEPKSIFDEIVDEFENGTLKEFIETIFTSEELKRILKEIPEFSKQTKNGWVDSPTSLLDKSRKFQSKEEKNDLNINDPRDIDHLSFGDKIQILHRKMHGKKLEARKWEKEPERQDVDLLRNLRKIKSLRDNLAHHGKRKFQQQKLTGEIKRVKEMMEWCNEFFKNYPGR